jgi:hypothetical protein
MNKQKRVFINKLLGISLFVVIFYLLVNSVFRVKDILSYGFDMRRIAFREVGKTGHSKEKDMGLISVGRAEGIVVPLDQAEEINLVTSYIIANTSLGEEVFAFPDLGYYNFFADRPCLGRFCYSDLSAYRQEWFDELYSRLKDKKPRYVVYSAYIEPLEKKLSGYPYTEYRKKIREYLMSNYHIEKSFDGVDILRLGPGK